MKKKEEKEKGSKGRATGDSEYGGAGRRTIGLDQMMGGSGQELGDTDEQLCM